MDIEQGIIQFPSEAFFLTFTRIISFLAVAPVFSRRGVPNIVKVSLALFLSMIVIGVLPVSAVNTSSSIGMFILMLVGESILGLAMGYMSMLVFAVVGMGGQLIDFQMGLSIGSVYDPATQTQSTLFGTMYNWIALLLLLSIDGHHYILQGIVQSFATVPAGGVDFVNYDATYIIEQFTSTIEIAFQIGMPILIVLILTDIIMGVIARTVPQLQIFILAIPIKIILGILFIMAMAELTFSRVTPIMQEIPEVIQKTIHSLIR